MTEEMEFIFTRYLFPKTEVKQALLLALLEHKTPEVLYWGYELYFSGFQNDLFEFLWWIYNLIYKTENVGLSKIFEDIIMRVENHGNDKGITEEELGSLLMTLSKREYDLLKLVETFFNRKCCRMVEKNTIKKRMFNIKITSENIDKYRTIETGDGIVARKVLENVYNYSLRKEYNHLFEMPEFDDYEERYREHWLKYTHGCPLWEKRVDAFLIENEDCENIEICIDGKPMKNHWIYKIEMIPDEFYDKYGYEPDEQSLKIQNMVIHKCAVDINLEKFCNDFGYDLVKNI